METAGTFVSWLSEATADVFASLSNPIYWVLILAVLVLVILYSIVSSINRLAKRMASVASELSAIRSDLRLMELSLGKGESRRTPVDREGKKVGDLRFGVDDQGDG